MIVISVCLSDIPKQARRTADNGKVYASFVIDERKDKDQYGNTHSVSISQSKEQRAAKEKKVYVGSGKEYSFGYTKPKDYEQLPDAPNEDDLPF